MVTSGIHKGRVVHIAHALDTLVAAVVKAACLRKVHGKRNRSLNREESFLLFGTNLMHGTD